ncbi:MAG: CheB methylesterase [Polaromonas sp.]|nr:CheB methylesterase [Polaromonas sp.]
MAAHANSKGWSNLENSGFAMNVPTAQQIIVMGASAGGVNAILELASVLPRDFPAPVLFVQHIGAHPSELWKLVSARGPNKAVTAADGDLPRPGMIHIAPPDHHMLLEENVIRLSRGPKEHHARPAIDPLFRSAALQYGPRVIGVVLTGMLDDGSAGLRAIKRCGGTAVVQDPADAFAPSMPQSALACVAADHVVPLAALGPLLYELASRPAPALPVPFDPPATLQQEHAVTLGQHPVENLRAISQPSIFSCPDCSGVLSELNDRHPVRFLCHTGHAFSLRSLAHAQEQVTDAAVWSSLRALQEKEMLLRRLAQVHGPQLQQHGRAALREADELASICAMLRKLIEKTPDPGDFNASA